MSRTAVVVACLAACAWGCAERMGRNTAAGAAETFARKVDPAPGKTPAQAVASRTVEGATDQLRQQLGPEGEGPLADSVVATLERSSAGAVRGAMTALLATCDVADPNCLDRRVSELSGRAAVAFTDGVKRSIGLSALIVSFVAGAGTVLLVLAVWMVLRGHRRGAEAEGHRAVSATPDPAQT